jgi:hypothetical protein
MKSALQTIAKLEQIVQRDEGGRGMRHLCQPSGTLATTALALFHAQNVVLVTGFPCLMQHDIPTETDGPSGTVAICRALTRMDKHKKVVIVTDDCNKPVIEACMDSMLYEYNETSFLKSFPPSSQWNDTEQRRLMEVVKECDHILALERASESQDGNAYTMSGAIMGKDMLAPLDQLFSEKVRQKYPHYETSCVGDGGNEMGMHAVRDAIVTHIPNGALIASASSADHVIAASVSNWGGYAVAAALEVLAIEYDVNNKEVLPWYPLLLPNVEETRAVEAVVQAGGRDGVTGKLEASVDGMSLDVSLGILNELRNEVDLYAKKTFPPMTFREKLIVYFSTEYTITEVMKM